MKTFGPAINDAGPGSDIRLVQAALANLHLLADLLERARLDMPLRRDAHPAGDSYAESNLTSAITTPEPPTGTPPVPTTDPETPPRRGSTFWDEP